MRLSEAVQLLARRLRMKPGRVAIIANRLQHQGGLPLANAKRTPPEITADDLALLLIAVRLATRNDYTPIFEFARATGLRLDECLVRWQEVDWETGWITTIGKGGRTVKTAITPTVRAILLPLRKHHAEWVFTYEAKRVRKADAGYKGTGDARVRGQRYPVTYSGLKSQWKRIRKAAGVQDFRFHDFRHDLATKLLRATGNLKKVQKALSHADIKTTSRYAHVLDEEVAADLDAVQKQGTKSRKKSRSAGKKAG